MHASLGKGDPSRENPLPALPLTDSPSQIWRLEILGRFSLLVFQGLFFLFSWKRTSHRAG